MKFCCFFARALIYQVIFINAYLNLIAIDSRAQDLKFKYEVLEGWVKHHTNFSLYSLPFHEKLVNNNPNLFLQIFMGKAAFFALLGLFGYKFGAYMTVLVRIWHLMLYHNPFLPQYQVDHSYEIDIDLLYNIGFMLVLLMTTTDFCDTGVCGAETSAVDSSEAKTEKVAKEKESEKAPSSGGRKKKEL